MKARALELEGEVADPVARLNVLREYAQASILRSLHESEAFQALSFVGGTALPSSTAYSASPSISISPSNPLPATTRHDGSASWNAI